MRALWFPSHLVAAALALAVAAPARAELRISDLDVFLNDHEVTVHVVLLGALPDALHEGIQSGIPAHIRLIIELWQYQRSEEHTSELRHANISYAVFCLKKKKQKMKE